MIINAFVSSNFAREWDIIESRSTGIFSMVYQVERGDGVIDLKLKPLNVSKLKLIRKFQLLVLINLLKHTPTKHCNQKLKQ